MSEKFVATGKWAVPEGPLTVYLESHSYDVRGPLIPGRLLPQEIEHEGRVYLFDGVEPSGRARYTRKP